MVELWQSWRWVVRMTSALRVGMDRWRVGSFFEILYMWSWDTSGSSRRMRVRMRFWRFSIIDPAAALVEISIGAALYVTALYLPCWLFKPQNLVLVSAW